MDKNVKEKKLLKDWHNNVTNCTDIYKFPEEDHNISSYFIRRNDTDNPMYLMEYDFETLPQLREKLSEMWENEDYMQMIITPVLVAAMKNKPHKRDETGHENTNEEAVNCGETLPDFIYNF